MTIAYADFQVQWPEFGDSTVYTVAQFNLWAGVAYALLNADRWADQLDLAAALFIAHHLVLGRRRQLTAAAGGTPGEVQGPKTAKAVDKVSASMDTAAVTFENAAFWNMTDYGVQLMQLIRLFGAGGVQIHGCICAYQELGVLAGLQ